MRQHQHRFTVSTERRRFTNVTDQVAAVVRDAGVGTGLCVVFLRHTSASLVIQENADPAVQRDLAAYFDRLVPEGDPLYTHTEEGPDDMPGHVKAALLRTSESIPVDHGRLVLGTWQGIYVWEHRTGRHERELVVHVTGAA
jgi:secondary thiamine-phosphate synthase enzyme